MHTGRSYFQSSRCVQPFSVELYAGLVCQDRRLTAVLTFSWVLAPQGRVIEIVFVSSHGQFVCSTFCCFLAAVSSVGLSLV